MKKHWLFATLAALVICVLCFTLFPTEAKAATDGYLTYEIVDGEAIITNCDDTITGSIEVPANLGGYPVTQIQHSAFADCAGLTEVTLPNTVTYIANSAFLGCNGLTEITIPASVTQISMTALSKCENLTAINVAEGNANYISDNGALFNADMTELHCLPGGFTGEYMIPASVTTVADYAFYGCTQLTRVTVTGNVSYLTANAFADCTSLEHIAVISNNTTYSSDAYGVLYNKDQTEIIYVPLAFYGSYAIPDTITSIEEFTFAHRTGQFSVYTGNGVTTISTGAFLNCQGLETVVLGDSVSSIETLAFEACPNLQGFGVSDNNSNFSSGGQGVLLNKNQTELILVPNALSGDYTVCAGVTKIRDYAFAECAGLTNVTIGNDVTTIGKRAFNNCLNLNSATIGSSVQTIDEYAFMNCVRLSKIVIPTSVTRIADYAFRRCSELADVHYTGTENQWLDITIGVNNDYLTEATFHFESDGSAPPDPWYLSYNVFNEEAIITGCDTSVTGDIVLPETLGGYPITAINNNAFLYTSITSISLPDTVTMIGDNAFAWSDLSTIQISSSVHTIGQVAFQGCSNLSSFYVAEDNPFFSTDEYGVLFNKNKTELIFMPGALSGSYTIPDSVETVSYGAFFYCRNLQSLYIPASVKYMDTEAGLFKGCSNLERFWVDSNQLYYCADEYGVLYNKGMNKLLHVPQTLSGVYYVPEGVTSVNDAFEECMNIEGIVFPESLTNIDTHFYNCYNLKRVYIPATVTIFNFYLYHLEEAEAQVYYAGTLEQWDNIHMLETNKHPDRLIVHYNATPVVWNLTWNIYEGGAYITDCDESMSGIVTIPDTLDGYPVVGIDGWAFQDCDGITEVHLPDSVNYIGINAFAYCNNLTTVTMSDNVTVIGSSAFTGCTSLSNLDIPNGITTIEDHTFDGCESLTEIIIPNGVAVIRDGAFARCPSLTNIEIPGSVSLIGDYAFTECTSLTNVVLPYGVTSIGREAFKKCTSLESISLPNSLTSIGANAFKECSWLKSIIIPDSVTEVGAHVFEYCSNLKTAVIGSGLNRIPNGMFWANVSLKEITIPATVTDIDLDVFHFCDNLTDVYYRGTEAQKQNITIEDPIIAAATWHCNACIGAAEHTYTATVTKATLTTDGTIIYKCDVCGADGSTSIIPRVDVFSHPDHFFIWDGTQKTPVPIVWDREGNTLTEGSDYTISYPANRTEVGEYELVITFIGNYSGTKTLTFEILPAAAITTQPKTQAVKSGTTTKFTVTATGFGLEYYWQSSADGKTWKNCSSSSATKATFSFTSKTSHDGNYYRCKVTDYAGNVVYTDSVRLYVLGITTQPTTKIVKSGTTIKFTVKATGTGLKYQWQSSSDCKTWKNCSSSTAVKSTFSFTSKTSHNGNYYRCKVTDSAGNVVYTSTVRAYVLGVTTQPKTQTVKAGATIKFTVKATGTGLKYQWQSSTDGKTWKNCSSTSATKATFSFTSKTPHNGNYYRCKVTDSAGNTVYTSAVRAYVLGVTTQPKTQKVESGDTVKFTVKATGSGLKYQWQVSTNGKTWKNCSSTTAMKATFSFTGKTSHDGNYYRCKVTDSAGNVVYTDSVRLYVLGITEQPDKKTVTKGKTAKFEVEATGHSLKYQWQCSTDGGKTWKNCTSTSAKKAAFSFTTKTTHNGNYYRCRITDSAGNVIYTSKVKLTVIK